MVEAYNKCSPSTWVRSADGAKIQKKIWDETISVLHDETQANLETYI